MLVSHATLLLGKIGKIKSHRIKKRIIQWSSSIAVIEDWCIAYLTVLCICLSEVTSCRQYKTSQKTSIVVGFIRIFCMEIISKYFFLFIWQNECLIFLSETLECSPTGWNMSCVSMVHLYVQDMSMFAEVNSVYKNYFGINPPARYVVSFLEILVHYGYQSTSINYAVHILVFAGFVLKLPCHLMLLFR